MTGGRELPRTPGKRVSVTELGAYELYFYAPIAHAAILVEKSVIDPVVRMKNGPEWLHQMSDLTARYCAAIEQLIREETPPEEASELVAAPSRSHARRLVIDLRKPLVGLHRAVERALDAVIVRGSLWRDEQAKQAAERLDRALLGALAEARSEVHRRARSTTLPVILLAEISSESPGD